MRRLGVLLGTVVVAALLAGCGGGGSSTSDQAGAELRGAEESVGDSVVAEELQAAEKKASRIAHACIARRQLACLERESAAMKKMASTYSRLEPLINLDRYSNTAIEQARDQVEGDGLEAAGCHQGSDESWHC
jgi:hypothetical protein